MFYSLRAIQHEIELSLVLTCLVTVAFCVRVSDICTQKTLYQKFISPFSVSKHCHVFLCAELRWRHAQIAHRHFIQEIFRRAHYNNRQYFIYYFLNKEINEREHF